MLKRKLSMIQLKHYCSFHRGCGAFRSQITNGWYFISSITFHFVLYIFAKFIFCFVQDMQMN